MSALSTLTALPPVVNLHTENIVRINDQYAVNIAATPADVHPKHTAVPLVIGGTAAYDQNFQFGGYVTALEEALIHAAQELAAYRALAEAQDVPAAAAA